MIVISHDRYLISKVTDQLLVFKGHGRIEEFNGSYDDYLKQGGGQGGGQQVQKYLTPTKTGGSVTNKEGNAVKAAVPAAVPLLSSQSIPASITPSAQKEKEKEKRKVTGLTFNERKEFNRLESRLSKLHSSLQRKEEEMEMKSTDSKLGYSVLQELSLEISAIQCEIETKELRWLELAEKE